MRKRTENEQNETPTNEALSAQVKAGDRDALATLWEQNRGLLALMFRRLAARSGRRMQAAGVTLEDLEQEGYFLSLIHIYRGVCPGTACDSKQAYFEAHERPGTVWHGAI